MTTTLKSEPIETKAMPLDADGFQSELAIHPRRALLFAASAISAFIVLLYSGMHSRVAAESQLKKRTEEAAVPSVAGAFPREGARTQEIVLPGSTQAFSNAPIYGRTSGYLKRWYFDIGARVKSRAKPSTEP